MSIDINKTFKTEREFVSSTLPMKSAVPKNATARIKTNHPNIPKILFFSLVSFFKKIMIKINVYIIQAIESPIFNQNISKENNKLIEMIDKINPILDNI